MSTAQLIHIENKILFPKEEIIYSAGRDCSVPELCGISLTQFWNLLGKDTQSAKGRNISCSPPPFPGKMREEKGSGSSAALVDSWGQDSGEPDAADLDGLVD